MINSQQEYETRQKAHKLYRVESERRAKKFYRHYENHHLITSTLLEVCPRCLERMAVRSYRYFSLYKCQCGFSRQWNGDPYRG